MGPTQGRNSRRLMTDINVTPLVDVMLVLLIIFMITAPMMTQGLNVDLPETTSKALRQDDKPIIITVTKDGEISINNTPHVRALMVQELQKSYAANKEQMIILRADKNALHGDVVTIMEDIKSVGFEKVGIMTTPPESK